MTHSLKTAFALTALLAATQAAAQITLYEGQGFRGRAFTTAKPVADFARTGGLNDRTSSVVVDRGRWEVCEDSRYRGRCVVLKHGSYDSLQKIGLENRISSVRPAEARRRYEREENAQMETPDYAWRRRANETVYQAPVTAVRAVMGAPSQRCWMERQQVAGNSGGNVGGTLAGALIGGVLGHQVGGGSGRDAATAGGAVAGALIGHNMTRNEGVAPSRNVQRCENTVSGDPAYWDVTYNFRGREHQLQMSAPPGRTVSVNASGEPRQ